MYLEQIVKAEHVFCPNLKGSHIKAGALILRLAHQIVHLTIQ